MRKWWRRFKNKYGWDFSKEQVGLFFYRGKGIRNSKIKIHTEQHLVTDPNGCYMYSCKYCEKDILFPWKETILAYHNMQRHIKAKHIDIL